MKKLFILIVLLGWCLIGYGQRITQLNEATEAEGESLIMVRQGTTGNVLSKITKTNFLGNIEADSLVLINSGADVMFREGSDTLKPYIPVAYRLNIGDVAMLLTDTIPMVNATIGQGNAGDTTLFSYGDVPWGIKWDGSFNLVITKVTAVVYGTTPDIDIQLYHDANFRDATPTTVLSSNLTVTNTTTGADATSFASATIAPGQWLYVQIKQCTAQPKQAILNIYGYLTR